jgi:hypothetical protein
MRRLLPSLLLTLALVQVSMAKPLYLPCGDHDGSPTATKSSVSGVHHHVLHAGTASDTHRCDHEHCLGCGYPDCLNYVDAHFSAVPSPAAPLLLPVASEFRFFSFLAPFPALASPPPTPPPRS